MASIGIAFNLMLARDAFGRAIPARAATLEYRPINLHKLGKIHVRARERIFDSLKISAIAVTGDLDAIG